MVHIGGRELIMRKRAFDQGYLDEKDQQGYERFDRQALAVARQYCQDTSDTPDSTLALRVGRKESRLSQSTTAEDVEYPTFVHQPARWSLASRGKITVYDELSAYVASLTKRYQWEGFIRNQALSTLKSLRPRRDLAVWYDREHEVPLRGNRGRVKRMRPTEKTTMERRVQCLKAVLEKMASEYDAARRDFSRNVSLEMGLGDLNRTGTWRIAGQKDVQVVKGLVWEWLAASGSRSPG